jgi:hypothetical protein
MLSLQFPPTPILFSVMNVWNHSLSRQLIRSYFSSS